MTIRRLTLLDLEALLSIQERIYDGLADKAIFQRSTSEFISYCLGNGGLCYGAYPAGEMIAYRMVYFPRDREFNLAKDCELPTTEYPFVAHWDTLAVLPCWRGQGLAKRMNARALADLASSSVRHLFANSSPDNPAGIGSLITTGFRPVKLVKKFGGKYRLLFYRSYPDRWQPPARENRQYIKLTSYDNLRHAFQAGFVGSKLVNRGGSQLLELYPPASQVSATSKLTCDKDQL